MPSESTPITYAGAGVDAEAGDRAVSLMKASVTRAQRPEVLGGLGGFAGMFDASVLARMTRPVLATSTDGVGTKVAIAWAMDKHDTIGIDLVGMVVDDIVVDERRDVDEFHVRGERQMFAHVDRADRRCAEQRETRP